MKIVFIMAAKLNNKSLKEVYFCCSLFNMIKKNARALWRIAYMVILALWADKLNTRCHLPLTLVQADRL